MFRLTNLIRFYYVTIASILYPQQLSQQLIKQYTIYTMLMEDHPCDPDPNVTLAYRPPSSIIMDNPVLNLNSVLFLSPMSLINMAYAVIKY